MLLEFIQYLAPDISLSGDYFDTCPVCGGEMKCRYYQEDDRVFCFKSSCELNSGKNTINRFREITGTDVQFRMFLKGVKSGDFELVPQVKMPPKICRYRPIFSEIYNKAAEEMHNYLMQNQKALDYLTMERRHSISSLQTFMIGYVDDNLGLFDLLNLEHYPWNEDDLADCGLFYKMGDGYRCVGSFEPYSYPLFWNGKCRTIKFKPPKSRGYATTIVKDATGSDFPDGMGDITLPEVIFVEGESDFLSMWDKGYKNVCCTHGKPRMTQLKYFDPLTQRGLSAMDHDKAGEEHTSWFSEHFPNVARFDYPAEYHDPDDWVHDRKVVERLSAVPTVKDYFRLLLEPQVGQSSRQHLLDCLKYANSNEPGTYPCHNWRAAKGWVFGVPIFEGYRKSRTGEDAKPLKVVEGDDDLFSKILISRFGVDFRISTKTHEVSVQFYGPIYRFSHTKSSDWKWREVVRGDVTEKSFHFLVHLIIEKDERILDQRIEEIVSVRRLPCSDDPGLELGHQT